MICVWIFYPTTLWVSDKAYIMPDMVVITPQNINTISPPTAPETCSAVTLDIGANVVVQGWWYMYGYNILLFHECYMRHRPRLIGMNHHTDHCMTSNYTPASMLSCYPGFHNQEVEPCTSISGVVVQEWWYMYEYALSLSYECYLKYILCLPGVDCHTDTDHNITSNYIPSMLICYPGYWNQEQNLVWSVVM